MQVALHGLQRRQGFGEAGIARAHRAAYLIPDDAGDEIGRPQAFAQAALVEGSGVLGGDGDDHPHDGVVDVMYRQFRLQQFYRVAVAGVQAEGDEAPRRHGDEGERGIPFFDLRPHEALVFPLLAKVDALDAARVHHRGLGALVQILVAMDVPQGDVIPGGVGQGAERDHRVVPHHHDALLGTEDGVGDAAVEGEHGGQRGVELFGQGTQDFVGLFNHQLVGTGDRQVFVLVA